MASDLLSVDCFGVNQSVSECTTFDATKTQAPVTASAELTNLTQRHAFEIENADPFLQMLNKYQFDILIPSLVLITTVMVIGIPGNIATIYVYRTRMRRTASRMFILAIAICDLLNCLLTMPFEIAIICQFWTFDFPVPCKISRTITYTLNASASLLLVGIAVDRYRKICSPLKPVFTPSNTKIICLVAIGIGFAASIPGFCLYGTRTYHHPVPNITDGYFVAKTCLIDDLYTETPFPLLFVSTWTVVNLTICVVLVVLYSLIGRAVFIRSKLERERERTRSTSHASRKQFLDLPSETSCSFDDILDNDRTKAQVLNNVSTPVRHTLSDVLKNKMNMNGGLLWSPKRRQKERMSKRIRAGRTTIMLFSVTVVFICCFVPFQIIVIIRSLLPNAYHDVSSAQKAVFNFFLRSYVVNCSLNPILYGFFNKDFRIKAGQAFRALLCCSTSSYPVKTKGGSGHGNAESES